MTALHWAALKNDADLAQTLLVCRRERQSDDAHRQLHAAAAGGAERQRRGHGPLITAGADVNAQDRERHDGADARVRLRQTPMR